ncbi:hypothetical protein ACFHYQ_25885 [Sphaerimonospora cavernae]|uniref:Transmembrane protein n=1 Tax=Sphaerimonospora cavernae TaxID=1740611 RepID=A0ABV6UC48_9ACTN
MNPEEAAQNLATIRETQVRAVGSHRWFPAWYMAGIGLFVTGIQFVTEPGAGSPVKAVVAALLAAGLGALAAVFVGTRRMTVDNGLAWPAFLPVFLPWLAVGLGLALGSAFFFSAMEVPYGRTYGGLAFTAFMAATSPLISRWVARRMARKLEAGL